MHVHKPEGWGLHVLECRHRSCAAVNSEKFSTVPEVTWTFWQGSSENLHVISAQGQEEVKEDNKEDK